MYWLSELAPQEAERRLAPFWSPPARVAVRFDELSIALPAGFVLDSAENPGKIDFGQPGWYDLKMGIRNKNELVITRELVFGQEGLLGFKREAYPTIKAVFDAIHGHDTVALTLRLDGAAK